MTTKMTEEAYIFRGDLMALMCARECLLQITPANNPNIVDAEFAEVHRKMSEWLDAMFAEIELSDTDHTVDGRGQETDA